ncbi:MAG TPA: ATP synthase F0 subunit B [Polyangiaceae bacterium]|jgi:F-type H+-transporting ATPase subunit b
MARAFRLLPLCALLMGLSLSARASADQQQIAAAHAPPARPAPAPAQAEDPEQHVPSFDDINWYYGVFGEKEGVEPSLLYRPKGMPVPFGAMLFNSAVLFFLLFRFGRKPVMDGLRARKVAILRGIEEAEKMRAAAEARLAEFEQKLATIEEEITRVRDEMRATGETERKRILSEAQEKRARMERDARVLIEQELKATHELLLGEMVRGAVRAAEATLLAKITAQDHTRLAEEHLAGLKTAAITLRAKA